ncbi:MAG: glycoside hydrolase family 16 protein [Polyangiales bacterium]
MQRNALSWVFFAAAIAGCGSSDGGDSPLDGGADAPASDTTSVTIDAPDDATPTDSTASEGSTDDASSDGATTETGPAIEFLASDEPLFDSIPHAGTVTFGTHDALARDGNVVDLLLPGGTATVGPGGAAEIDSKKAYTYGTFRFRVRLATCAKNEELVNGLFLYANDGKDHDGDGIVDNSEIDIEILCGQPTFINMTSWTEYTDDAHMRKQSRTVDLETGKVYIGNVDAYGYDEADPRNGKVDPALAHPGFYDPKGFYEMGYQWSATSIRFFIMVGGKELTLYTTEDPKRVPKAPMQMLFNLWHPDSHWNEAGSAATAAKDATLSIDWFQYGAAK